MLRIAPYFYTFPLFAALRQALLLCCLGLLFGLNLVEAQNHAFTLYNEKHGLPSGFVTNVFKDSRGIIWLGTTNGLCRFDGRNFVTYDLKNGIPDFHVKYLEEHTDGRLIVGFHTGVYFFDGRHFEKKLQAHPDSAFYFYRIHRAWDKQTKLIINGEHFTWKKEGFRPMGKTGYPLFTTWIKYREDTILSTISGSVYWARTHGRVLLLPETGRHNAFQFLNQDTLLIAKRNALYCFDGKAITKLAAFELRTGKDILDITISENRYAWISIENFGTLKYDLRTRQTEHFNSQNSILSNYEVPVCYGDDLVWFASSHGLIKCTRNNFIEYKKENNPVFSKIKAFLPLQDNDYLLSNDQGLFHLTLQKNQSFTTIPLRKQSYFTPVSNMAPSHTSNGFWLADYQSNLFFYRSSQQQLTEATTLNRQLSSEKALVKPWYSPSLKRMLFSGNGKVLCIDGAGKIRDTLVVEPAPGVYLRQFGEDSKGNTWGMHLDGICKLSHKIFHPVAFIPAFPANAEFISLLIQRDTIWAGTLGDGLYGMVDGPAGLRRVVHFNEANGLKGNCVYQMVADAVGDIWLITNKGFQCLLNKGGFRKPVSVENESLSFSALIYSGVQCDLAGRIWFHGPDNLYAISPRGFKKEVPISPVFITSVWQADSIMMGPFSKTRFSFTLPENISLSHRHNNLTIHFSAMCYNDEGVQYQYKLDGAEETWNTDRKEEQVTYTGLAPGTYSFRVRAATPSGNYGPESTFSFTIRPPFYETGWFISVFVITIALAGFGWYRHKIGKIRKETAHRMLQNKRMAQMQMQALQAQMNPHFIFNSLNSIQDYILSREPAEASRYLAKFAKLVRMILENSSRNLMPVQEVADMMNRYLELESLRMDEDFEYIISIDEKLDASKTAIPLMMVQPFVENAIWHGLMPKKGKKHLQLIFTSGQMDGLRCIIDDNGVGRQKESALKPEHRSLR